MLEGIRTKSNHTFRKLYREVLPVITHFITLNNGSECDAKDVFQEAIIIVYRKSTKENLELKCRLETYLFSICKKIWLTRLRYQRNHPTVSIEDCVDLDVPTINDHYFSAESECNRLFYKHFKRLSEKCQEVLKLYFKKIPYDVIVKKLGMKNKVNATSKKYRCTKLLVKNIQNDPELSKIAYDEERIEIF